MTLQVYMAYLMFRFRDFQVSAAAVGASSTAYFAVITVHCVLSNVIHCLGMEYYAAILHTLQF